MQAGCGLVALYIVSSLFSPLEQGYFYLFSSLIALQLFFDLGMNVVLVNLSSHEWAVIERTKGCNSDDGRAARSRLASLIVFARNWYFFGAIAMVGCFYFVGIQILERGSLPRSDWHIQWIAHLLFSSISFAISPVFSVLEGCNKISSVNFFRAIQLAGSYFLFFLAARENVGLAAVSVFSGSMVLFSVIYIVVFQYKFLQDLLADKFTHRISWRSEIFGFHSKIFVQGIFSYFGYYALTPVVFHYHGATAAGQLGLSLQVGMIILLLSSSLFSAKVPGYGYLYANGRAAEAVKEWRKDSSLAISLAVAFVISLLTIQEIRSPVFIANLLDRGLPALPAAFIYLGACALVGVQAVAAVTRANKTEILTVIGVVSPLLILLISSTLANVLLLQAAPFAYFVVNALFALPASVFLFKVFQRKTVELGDQGLAGK
jgi:hypothetical protein